MIDWWSETDHAILECLLAAGPMSPEDLSRRIGLSPGETSAFVAMLVREGRIRIRLVELTQEEVGSPEGTKVPSGHSRRSSPRRPAE
jgi:DNA-binding Lrp family transcriptional regulator